MNSATKTGIEAPESQAGLVRLAVLSVCVGGVAGFMVALFRLALDGGDRLRDGLIFWGHGKPVSGFLVIVVGAAAATSLSVWMVRRFAQQAAGSGIPHVEAVMEGQMPPAPFQLVPVKFVGGVLAMGAGLALGREGPGVQMGASLGWLIGKLSGLSRSDSNTLLAAGAGAGLATAFNAPIAGAVFVLEELTRKFDTRIAIAALGASGAGIAVAQLLLGQDTDFRMDALPISSMGSGFLYIGLGVLAGLAGVAYNRTILGALAMAERLESWPAERRGAVIGAIVGAVAWFAPAIVGGGHGITQQLLGGSQALSLLSLAFIVRFLLGGLSYSAGVPGGLFAPMLVLGAQLGLLVAGVVGQRFASSTLPPNASVVVGMAAFFTAVVRAPLTGVILIVEMTGCSSQLLPMLWACFAAMAVPTVLGNRPIYDSLRERAVRSQISLEAAGRPANPAQPIALTS